MYDLLVISSFNISFTLSLCTIMLLNYHSRSFLNAVIASAVTAITAVNIVFSAMKCDAIAKLMTSLKLTNSEFPLVCMSSIQLTNLAITIYLVPNNI